MTIKTKKSNSGTKTIILIGIIIFALGVSASFFFVRTVEHFFWQVRTAVVLDEIRAETSNYVTKKDILDWQGATSSARINNFALTIKNSSPFIIGLKLYDPDALVIWSDLRSVTVGTKEPRVATEFADAPVEEQVIDTAEPSVKIELGKENLLEVYTSIKASDGEIIGFVETYFDTTELLSFVNQVRTITWGGLIIVLGIILSLLRFAFRKQNTIIDAKTHELSDIVTNSPVGICTTYPEGTIISVNPKLLQICGIADEKILLDTIIFKNELVKEMKLDGIIREALLGAPFETEGHFIKNNMERSVRVRGTPIFTHGEKTVERLLLTVEDITKRKALEKESFHHTQDLESRVAERTQDLQKKIAELEQFQRITVDRELRMTELKHQVERMRIKLESLGAKFNEEDYKN
jgi:PAS domain S-box-containing protein